jgi:hypothetical protein
LALLSKTKTSIWVAAPGHTAVSRLRLSGHENCHNAGTTAAADGQTRSNVGIAVVASIVFFIICGPAQARDIVGRELLILQPR